MNKITAVRLGEIGVSYIEIKNSLLLHCYSNTLYKIIYIRNMNYYIQLLQDEHIKININEVRQLAKYKKLTMNKPSFQSPENKIEDEEEMRHQYEMQFRPKRYEYNKKTSYRS